MKKIYLLIFALTMAVFSNAQNVTTNSGSGLASTYADLASAITALNGVGSTFSPVVITLNANETAPAGGYVITAVGSSGAPITIQGSSYGNVIQAYSPQATGSINDAIFKIKGGSYITIQNLTMKENPANFTIATDATGTANNMTEWGISVLYTSTTQGSQHITIQNDSISLNRTYTNTFGIYSSTCHADATPATNTDITSSAGDNSNLHIYGNTISNVNYGIAVLSAPAFPGSGLDIGGSSSATGNTIYNFGTANTNVSAYARLYVQVYGVLTLNQLGVNIQYNTIGSSNPAYYNNTSAGVLAGVYNTSTGTGGSSTSPTFPGTANTNTISNNSVAIQLAENNTANTNYGIHSDFGDAHTSVNISSNNFHNLLDSGAAVTTPKCNFWIVDVSGICLNETITNNTYTDLNINTYGYVRLINNTAIIQSGTQTISNNSTATALSSPTYYMQVTYSAGGATQATNGITDAAAHLAGSTILWQNNNFSKIYHSAQAGITMFNCSSGSTFNVTKTFSNNIFSNITDINGTFTGMLISGGTGTGATTNVYSNTVTNATAKTSVTGISVGTGVSVNVYKNKISDLSVSNGSATSVATGITTSSLTTITPAFLIYDNLIANLTTNSTVTNLNGIIGINIAGNATGKSAAQVYHNTIYIGTASGGATYGTSGVTFDNSTITSLDLRNNIIINLSTPSGTGGIAAGLRALTAGTSGTVPSVYSSSSNNNVFYVNPSAGISTHLTYVEGSSSSVNPENTVVNFKTFTSTGTGGHSQDAASYEDNISFLSTTYSSSSFLQPVLAGYYSGATGTGITTDYSGATRSSTLPDVGAYESTGKRWIGATSTTWATGTNWRDGSTPSSSDAVTVGYGSTNYPVLTGNITTAGLGLQPSTKITIGSNTLAVNGNISGTGVVTGSATSNLSIGGAGSSANLYFDQTTAGTTNVLNNFTLNSSSGSATLLNALNLKGTFTPTAGALTTGGYLTLLSTSSGTGSIAQGSGSYLSGNVNVQRYVGSSLQWRMVGLPFTAATTISQSALRGFYTSGYNAYSYNEAGDNGAYGGSGGVNAGWVPFTSGTITSDKGLLLSGGTISSAINFTGPVNTGTQSIALGYSSGNTNKGWNLIANPYASNINWTTIIGNNPSGVQNAIYRYDPNTTAYASYVNGSNSGNQSNVIENGAGFFVHSTSATTLSIQESDKTSSAAMASLFGVQPSTSQDKSIIKLSLLKQGETYGDEVVVRWGVDPATDGFDDKYDAYDLGRVKGADLSVIGNDGTTYSIFHGSALRSKDIEQRVIALGTKNMDAGNYSFNTSLLSAMYGGNQVYLVDNYSNQSTLIDAATASYPFVVTADPNSASVSRFILALNYKPKINTVTGNGILLLNNPSTNNQFNIVIGSDYQRVNWELVDNNGRVMQSGVFSGVMKGVVNIAQTQNTSAGTYFIKLIADGKVLPTQKWIKQ